jgi:hypothetical protein
MNQDLPDIGTADLVDEYIKKSAEYVKVKSAEKKRKKEEAEKALTDNIRQQEFMAKSTREKEQAQNIMAMFEKNMADQNAQFNTAVSVDDVDFKAARDELVNTLNLQTKGHELNNASRDDLPSEDKDGILSLEDGMKNENKADAIKGGKFSGIKMKPAFNASNISSNVSRKIKK